MARNKNSKDFKKLKTLAFGGPIVLQGTEILKTRGDSAKLSKVAAGTLKVGVVAGFAEVAFDLASDPFGEKKKKRK